MENVLPGFNLPMKLIGQGGSNLNYIKNETGAIVTLRGIGSAFLEPGTQQEAPEPLHFCITLVRFVIYLLMFNGFLPAFHFALTGIISRR